MLAIERISAYADIRSQGGGLERMMADSKVDASKESRCNCTALRKATRRVSQLYDAALAPSGLKTTKPAILPQLSRSEPAAVGELAAALVMDAGALAHTLKPLERDGFLAVGIDRADRRVRLISLTPAGRAKLAETDRLWAQAQRCFD